MAYKAPHFGNLSKRAKALGMKVTRVTTDEDARMFGGHEYVLTQADASTKTIDNASCHSLNGIRAEIESIEKINGKDWNDSLVERPSLANKFNEE